MKARPPVHRQFWDLPVLHRLRPRLMTMILALVLPVSLISLALSAISVFQSAEATRTANQNAFSFYIDEVALRNELGDIDVISDFPATLAKSMTLMYWNTGSKEPGSNNGSSVYVSRDGEQAFIVHPDGTWDVTDKSFSELKQTREYYAWEKEGKPFQVLVAFPYDFSLQNIPAWFWISILISFLTILACPVLYARLRYDILNPMQIMTKGIEAFREDRTARIPPQTKAISDDFLGLYEEFNRMAAEVQGSYEKDIKLLETEMDNLRLQVNPHMLLNSYNTIYALAESKNYPVIQDYALCLVDYFRYVLRRGQQLVTVKQELDFVDNFIRIQRIRYPGRFSYVYQSEDECLNALIPPLLIENFVENAVKYALEPREAIEIVVSVRKDQNKRGKDALHIAITDTGSGIHPQVLEKLKAHEPYIDESGNKHIGIWNCLRRIELFYGEEGEVSFASGEGMGTQIYLVVPFRTHDEPKGGLPA